MGYNTKIDWCDTTWNPVTGCYHGCEYCYARGIAERFGGFEPSENANWNIMEESRTGNLIAIADGMQARTRKDGKVVPAPYPFRFTPTLHRYRLDEPKKWTEPRNIFVCSMADLFGKWVPDEWIEEVIKACLDAPQHRYLFLTKNPARYIYLIDNGIIPEDQPNFWLGSTATIPEMEFFYADCANTFISIEPILAPFQNMTDAGKLPVKNSDWIIVGAETGNRRNKVIPQKAWIDELVECAKATNTPIFMKESLRSLMGSDFRQEFPWEVKGNA